MPDAFDFYFWSQRKLTLHGSAVEIACACDELVPQIDHLAQPFREADFPEGFVPIRGTIEPYYLDDVLKHLSTRAVRLPAEDQPFDLYRDGDRFYRVDDTYGLTLIDLVRRRWHSWVTPEAMESDPVRTTDAAVLWPLAQLMARRGVQMIPAVAVAREGFGVLLLGELSLEPELSLLLAAGYKLIGQRWVALREDEGNISMLHLPGHVQRKDSRRSPDRQGRFDPESWVDLHGSHPRSKQNHEYCDVVLVCGAGRRDQVRVKPVGWAGAMNVVRRAWPIVDLPPLRRGGKMVARMVARAKVAELQLSRDPRDLLAVLETLQYSPAMRPPTSLAASQVSAASQVAPWLKTSASRPAAQSA